MKARVAEIVGHAPVNTLHRLEEFVEPWELMCARREARARRDATRRDAKGVGG